MINCKDSFEIVLNKGLKIYTNFYDDDKASLTILNSSLDTIKINDTYSEIFNLISILSNENFDESNLDLIFAYNKAYPENIKNCIKNTRLFVDPTNYKSLEDVADHYIDDFFTAVKMYKKHSRPIEVIGDFVNLHKKEMEEDILNKFDDRKFILYKGKVYRCQPQ